MGVSATQRERRSGREPLDVEAAALAASVAVMAPALTEGGPQKPENLLPSLPAGGFLSAEQATQVCQNREILTKFVVPANVQPSKIDDQCLRGVSKDLIRDVINSKYASNLDSLSAFASASDLIAKDLTEQDFERPVTPDEPQVIDFIMNVPSMGDQTNNMGFLKSSADLPLVASETAGDNKNLDVDQIMAFGSDEQCNIGNVADIGHNVDEILQVIKSIEGADSAENISAGGSEPVQSAVEMFAEEGFASFERDLLNDVDVMSLCNDNMNISDTVDQQKSNNLRLQHIVAQKQFENERRSAFLLRRLRKLQARTVGRHVAEETTGVLELAHHGVKKYLFQELVNISSKSNVRNFPEISSSLHSFLQKIEKMCVAQSNSANRQRVCCRYFGGGSRDNLAGASGSNGSNRQPVFGTHQVKLNGEEVESVAGPLSTQLHVVESNLDSDCTASSSGGESCDEMQTFNNPHQQHLPISKRAAWRYAQDRAGVASRWTWLQAQISDLEYRIRQHNDLQRNIRATKGLVILDNAETVNGYSGALPGSTGRYNSSESELPASRTRPFVWSFFRKRKLLQVDKLHEVSKRAAKASTVRCNCDHVLPACALCTGRLDPMQPQEPIEQLSIQERVALVDPSFHPVLSFPDEIVHGTHLDTIMKSTEWQQKTSRANLRVTRVKDKDGNERRSKKLPGHRTKYTARLKKSSSTILTARIKRKVLKNGKRNRIGHERSVHGLNKKRISKLPTEDDDDISALSSSSKHSSPVPSPLQHVTASLEKNAVKEKSSNSHGRLRQNSYDIDNIVIPYSVAASTRLEKLQYKEILTPKWRLCEEPTKMDVKNGVMHMPCQEDSDFEDISDETIALRHERSEREENKRFMTYINMPHQTRIRHNQRRVDSRADSGANTPDPMSPHASDLSGDVISPITSPPATPSQQDTEHPSSLDSHRPTALQNALRRRAMPASTLRLGRDDVAFTEDENEVPSYEPRIFPLSEEDYSEMLKAMPDGHWQASSTSLCSRDGNKADDDVEMDSPESDSTESACCDIDGEDPNDPEWTVADDRDTEKERIRPTAKR
ncbi:PREDICTED: KAT8 regulatory NSL complex subunit 1 [Dinoponera quadriceps]|uniref:KAT8 regulatory NSL complex subunit 1 n=1 Tax=Dinoponera quadriceps TaxID=609295 RepID=A0A6P3X4J2_DINQU|nr:PREDICTED: KAT8 regulatory NSL complex subunit 1 [Dinoponera quadriceps]XP_014473265.1 PREDICTED: KAT8 regulatory NSL complex subunit 1 [Dinoponera quadriceps]XP_014473266.1 PREDICTED: KAT8 regulatory NSL complex subunit 1 [Dinoponera quadriceps]